METELKSKESLKIEPRKFSVKSSEEVEDDRRKVGNDYSY